MDSPQSTKPEMITDKEAHRVVCSCGIGLVRKSKGNKVKKPKFKLVEVVE